MAPSFNCPACGAPITLSGEYQESVPCSYCNNVVAVPELLRPAAPPPVTRVEVVMPAAPPTFETPFQPPPQQVQIPPEEAKKWGRILLIFIIIVFVLPTCIGIAASILGALVGIIAPLLAFFFN